MAHDLLPRSKAFIAGERTVAQALDGFWATSIISGIGTLNFSDQ